MGNQSTASTSWSKERKKSKKKKEKFGGVLNKQLLLLLGRIRHLAHHGKVTQSQSQFMFLDPLRLISYSLIRPVLLMGVGAVS